MSAAFFSTATVIGRPSTASLFTSAPRLISSSAASTLAAAHRQEERCCSLLLLLDVSACIERGGNCLEVSILGRVVERTAMRCCDDVVILRPGDHQKVTHQNRYFVPYDVVLPSGDDNFHICLHPTEEEENCFFAPADAM